MVGIGATGPGKELPKVEEYPTYKCFSYGWDFDEREIEK